MGRRTYTESFLDDEDDLPIREPRRSRRSRESDEELLRRLVARRKLEEMWEAKQLMRNLSDVFADDPDA
ncbi:MAG: hypothetical protein B7Z66_05015 [Chromatiales bacterium 21-64-14]|nr:MAG: hypothetical protein B7Z66_05015 [Chromatiales bacterium 21-64-14]HQU16463.1 hypothetical protein [Gammaproteobacteria bacterium]